MNRATSNRRLLKLAEFLEKLPRKRFDYGIWLGHDWQGKPDLSCGTQACALGWAAAMPEFQRLGLRLERSDMAGPIVNHKLGAQTPAYAAMVTFGLSGPEEAYVFEGSSLYDPTNDKVLRKSLQHDDPSPRMVATHIRRFVSYREKRANAV